MILTVCMCGQHVRGVRVCVCFLEGKRASEREREREGRVEGTGGRHTELPCHPHVESFLQLLHELGREQRHCDDRPAVCSTQALRLGTVT